MMQRNIRKRDKISAAVSVLLIFRHMYFRVPLFSGPFTADKYQVIQRRDHE